MSHCFGGCKTVITSDNITNPIHIKFVELTGIVTVGLILTNETMKQPFFMEYVDQLTKKKQLHKYDTWLLFQIYVCYNCRWCFETSKTIAQPNNPT